MGVKEFLSQTTIAKYGRAIRATPREMLFNPHLILTAMMYAMCGVPQTWDQGAAATVPSLKGFQSYFGLDSDADQVSTFVSIIYIGYAIGAAGSFLLNNRLGRLWSYRIYVFIYIVGQIIAVFAPNLGTLYAARIIAGIGIGSVTVIGPIALVEISPVEIRGLLTSWYVVAVSATLMIANFCVYGILLHVPPSRLQYQIAWFAPCIYMALCILASFFLWESPRWLLLVGRRDEAIATFVHLRGLPADHPRIQTEIREVEEEIIMSQAEDSLTVKVMVKEMFTKTTNLRRLQQVLFSYALAQLSGANSITSYFVSISKIVGLVSDDPADSLFLSSMYTFSKLMFTLIASFFFIDALGRRKSLLIGVMTQVLSHLYIGVYIKKNQEGPVSNAASQTAIAALFIHAFGYAVGLLILPYVFGSELWPNRIRSFGTVLGSTFHWLFVYAMKYAFPPLLASTNNWGAFIFFAGWCFIAFVYVFFMVPEVSGLTVEQIEDLFRGPWFKAYPQIGARSPSPKTGK
ncbi:general substrate transporter [Aspergillus cavernicola]|uniref:General substrate transporter n=1 Tax=Aspergillus cavernicola TaxID=176166 RepID=A0ABR4I0M4_9EURO